MGSESLAPLALTLSLLYVVLALAHVLVIESPAIRDPMVVMAAFSAATFALLGAAVARHGLPVSRRNTLAFTMALLVLANCELHLYLSSDPKQSINTVLAVIGAGCFLSSYRAWLGIMALSISSWCVLGPLHVHSPEWVHYGFSLGMGVVLSALVFWLRHRYYHRLEESRGALEQKNRELTASLNRLAESEKRYRESQSVARLGSWQVTFDQESSELWWSEEVYHLFGMSPSSGTPTLEEHLEQIVKEDRPLWLSQVRQSQRTGAPLEVQFRNQLPDGTSKILRAQGQCRLNEAGDVVEMRGTVQDVTDMMRSRQELHATQQKNRAILHASPDTMLVISADGICQECHATGSGEGLAVTPKKIVGAPLEAILPPAHVPRFRKYVSQACRQTRGTYRMEYSVRDQDVHFFEARIVHGGHQQALVIIRNITDQKRTDCIIECERRALQSLAVNGAPNETLAELLAPFEALQLGALPSILLLDESGQRLRLGAAPQLPSAYNEAIDGIQIGPDVGTCGTAAHTGQLVVVENIAQDAKWDAFREVALAHNLHACWSVPIKDGEGVVLGTFATYYRTPQVPSPFELQISRFIAPFVAFILEQFHAEHALRESEARLRQLVETTHLIPWEADGETGQFRYVGPQIETLLGYPTTEWLSADFWSRKLHPEDREVALAIREGPQQTDTHYEREYRLLAEDGREVWVRDIVSVTRHNDVTTLRGFLQDITSYKRAEQERLDWESRLRETQKLESLGVMAGGIAHDFNNLLTGVLGYANLARHELDTDSDAHEYLAQIEASSTRAADLCKQMLAYAGRGRFDVQPLDVRQLVEETTQLLSVSIGKDTTLQFELDPETGHVLADATQLRQIVMNLVLNAAESLESGNGNIEVRTGNVTVDESYLAEAIYASELAPGRYVFLEVADNGCGMEEGILKRVFDPFFTTKFTGRGLGLAAVLGIVRSHEGALRVTSQVGEGSRFRILLPPTDVPQPRPTEKDGPPQNPLAAGAACALVVDDEPSVRKVVSRILETLGFEVTQAVDGLDALEQVDAASAPFRLALLDLTMPNLDGEQTFGELQKRLPEMPIVLMSGFTEQEASARFAGQPVAGFLQKPFRIDTVRDAVAAALKGSHCSVAAPHLSTRSQAPSAP